MLRICSAIAALLMTMCGYAKDVVDDFQPDGSYQKTIWNPKQLCQKLNGPADGPGAGSNRAYRFGIDEVLDPRPPYSCSVINGEELGAPAAVDVANIDALGPSMFPALGLVPNDPCAGYDRARIPPPHKTVKQKNELRMTDEHWPLARKGHWYMFRMRIAGSVETCGSRRLVLGQWKVAPSGESPFLAQRYDNAVLHITVQHGHCRCIVAKASGDPHAEAVVTERDEGGPIGQCVWAQEDASGNPVPIPEAESDPITGCKFRPKIEPLGSRVLAAHENGWVDMKYFIHMDADDREIVLHEGDRPVVRVTGPIGFDLLSESRIYMKLGIYQDNQKGGAVFFVDDVWVKSGISEMPPR